MPADANRPYPPPSHKHVMHMTWNHLLFIHWPVDADRLQTHLPEDLIVDQYNGRAYVGVIPFTMTNIHHRLLPPIPGFAAFPELNVRTYVRPRNPKSTEDDRPGVWFFSLDAAHKLAVRAARIGFHLNYLDAAMSLEIDNPWIIYHSTRTHRGAPEARFIARYKPTDDPAFPEEGSLEDFLTGRYCLYAADKKRRLYRGEIDHAPWPLSNARLDTTTNTMLNTIHMTTPTTQPLLHYARRVAVKAWTDSV